MELRASSHITGEDSACMCEPEFVYRDLNVNNFKCSLMVRVSEEIFAMGRLNALYLPKRNLSKPLTFKLSTGISIATELCPWKPGILTIWRAHFWC